MLQQTSGCLCLQHQFQGQEQEQEEQEEQEEQVMANQQVVPKCAATVLLLVYTSTLREPVYLVTLALMERYQQLLYIAMCHFTLKGRL